MSISISKQLPSAGASALGVCLAVLGWSFLQTAWVSDDAFISFRVVRNLIEGHGLVWNLGERVQVSTHPLWLLLISAISAITHDQYFTSLGISAACTAACVWMIIKVAATSSAAAVAVGCLALSRSFVDFSSSGLENPLSHALVALLILQFKRTSEGVSAKAFGLATLTCALLVMNRADLVLVVLPFAVALTWAARSLPLAQLARAIFLGTFPLILWLAFATLYFGSPLPNTSFAKLATGVPAADLREQGWLYARAFVERDPTSAWLLSLGFVATAASPRCRPGGVAVVLYCAYVINIGGDFMSGRFFSVLVLVAVLNLLLATGDQPRLRLPVGILLLPCLLAVPTILSTSNASSRDIPLIDNDGIADERAFYYGATGLMNNLSEAARKSHPFAQNGVSIGNADGGQFATCYVGMTGYYAPRGVHLVDAYGLTDPLLARLPALHPWRIGHFERLIPEGYGAVLAGRSTNLPDPALNRLWQDLNIAHRAPIWTAGRFEALWRINNKGWIATVRGSHYAFAAENSRKRSKWTCMGEVLPVVKLLDHPQTSHSNIR